MAQVITDVNQNADVNLQGLEQQEATTLGAAEKQLSELSPADASPKAETSSSSPAPSSRFGAIGGASLSSPSTSNTPIETKLAAGKMLDLAIMVTTGIPSLAFTALAAASEMSSDEPSKNNKSKFARTPAKSIFMVPSKPSEEQQKNVYDRIAPKSPGIIGAEPKKLDLATGQGFGTIFQTPANGARRDLMGDVVLAGSSLGGVTGFKTDMPQSAYLTAKLQGLRATVREAKSNLAQIRQASDMGLTAANLDGETLSQNVVNQLAKGQDGAERLLMQAPKKEAVLKYAQT